MRVQIMECPNFRSQFIQSQHNHSQTSTYQTKTLYGENFRTSFVSVSSRGDEETQIEKLHFPGNRKLNLLCSSDGLLLLVQEKYATRVPVHIFFLWNPSVRKYAKFSYPSQFTSYNSRIGCGLCYDSSTCDYKFVVIHQNHYFSYSVGKDSWGESKLFSYPVTHLTNSVFVDGALHWVATQKRWNSVDDGFRLGDIICFNPTNENFRMFHRPECVEEHCVFHLAASGGCLVFCSHYYKKRMMEIWFRRKGHDYNHTSSWEKMVIISDIPAPTSTCSWYCIKLICYLRGSEILLCIEGGLVRYDVKERHFLEVYAEPIAPFLGNAVPYVDSLLSPDVGDKPKRK